MERLIITFVGSKQQMGNIDPSTISLLARIGERMKVLKHPELSVLSPEQSRYYYEEAREFFTPIPVDDLSVFQTKVGQHGIPIRIYTPNESTKDLPIVLYCHGGGWVFGSIDSSDNFCRYMCQSLGSVIVSVGYRLAPEHPFPAALHDVFDTLAWIKDNGKRFGGDSTNISISGESSGANLAAAASLVYKSGLKSQLLITPVVDYHLESESYLEDHTYNLTSEKMAWFWNHYLKEKDNASDPLVSPLRADNLSNVAPVIIVTVEKDPLRSEGKAFAKKLHNEGLLIEHIHHRTLLHSFINVIGISSAAKRAVDDMFAIYKEVLHYDECFR